jgi:hypothetical protein
MKKLFVIVCTLVLGGALTFAQGGAGSKGSDAQAGDKTQTTTTTKKSSKKKGHKGGKKSKKGSTSTSTPAPK